MSFPLFFSTFLLSSVNIDTVISCYPEQKTLDQVSPLHYGAPELGSDNPQESSICKYFSIRNIWYAIWHSGFGTQTQRVKENMIK